MLVSYLPDDLALNVSLANKIINDDPSAAEKLLIHCNDLKPNSYEIINALGVANNKQAKFNKAIEYYKEAIALDPNKADAYNNMANAYQAIGDLELSFKAYSKALDIDQDYTDAASNLMQLLTKALPISNYENSIIKVNQRLREFGSNFDFAHRIPDKQIFGLLSWFKDQLDKEGLSIKTDLSQVYRRNSTLLNCDRHFEIFEGHNIIPEFCFGCYKVQVEPSNFLDLVRLAFVFDNLELDKNNTRKCMVEVRPEIGGTYKGFIYCSGYSQAASIAAELEGIVKELINPDLIAKVKRGCSEYALSFPEYNKFDANGKSSMNYNSSWKALEEKHDKEFPSINLQPLKETISGLSFIDLLIMQGWIDYARGIGDKCVEPIDGGIIFSSRLYSLACSRVKL